MPEWSPGPATFAVTPFENHVPNGKALEWIVAELPFEIAEKTEDVLGLEPIGAPLYVTGEQVPAEADTVAAFGAKQHAAYVVTGWYDKIGDDLRIDAIVWKIDHGHAVIAGEAQKSGSMPAYHAIVGEVLGDVWTKAGVAVEPAKRERLSRALSKDVYPVFMMGRGLGFLTGALGTADLKTAEHDLERAVFLDPKLYEAQRLIGELYLEQAPGDPKAAARAAAKFNYATDLAPDDLASLRAAAFATAASGKWELALEMFGKLVTRRPWDLEVRFQLGQAMWQLGDAKGAERQLEQVTAHQPDHLAARRVLVLVHASRGDTKHLITELEAIQARAPNDLEIKSDLAAAYGSLGQWPKAVAALEQVAQARPNDLALAVRVGDGHRLNKDLDGALAWYARAQRLAPESSLPGFATAQALFDAGKLADANRTYTNLQKYAGDLPATEANLGAIAFAQNRADDAAWYLRRATAGAPRSLAIRRDVIAAELARKDATAALAQIEPALAAWPDDPALHYLAGIAHALDNDPGAAPRPSSPAALQASRGCAERAFCARRPRRPRGARARVEAGAGAPVGRRCGARGRARSLPGDRDRDGERARDVSRPAAEAPRRGRAGTRGDGQAAGQELPCRDDRAVVGGGTASTRSLSATRRRARSRLPVHRAPRRDRADRGPFAERAHGGRRREARAFAVALADAGELRAEWARGLGPELRAAGCSDALLAAAVANPSRYHLIEEDHPDAIPAQTPPHAKPRSTFFVDNTGCPDPVDVWIDGRQIGSVAPGRRSALVADGGARTLCLIGPGAAQCGDRGTVRQVYLHDGWSVAMHCPGSDLDRGLSGCLRGRVPRRSGVP